MELHLHVLIVSLYGIVCFNVDVRNVINIKGPDGSYFGYSTLMFSNDNWEKWVIVGAPRANFTSHTMYTRPGNVFKCRINFTIQEQESCTEMNLEQQDIFRWPNSPGYEEDNELMGASMVLHNKKIVTCAPLWKNMIPWKSQHIVYAMGRCFNIDESLNTYSTLPFKSGSLRQDTSATNSSSLFIYEFAQIGFSMSPKEYDQSAFNILLGAPGFLENEGGYCQYDTTSLDAEFHVKSFTHPKFTEESVGIIKAGTLLGYSITTGKIAASKFNTSTVIVLGAPHYNTTQGILGSVIFLDPTNDTRSRQNIRKQMFGKKSASGFGSSVIFDDINNDGLDDLLVGAPLHYDVNTEIIDVGAVFIFYGTSDPTVLLEESSQVLNGSGKAFGRFGTSMQCINDINMDSYKDIVVSAPYEDNLKGAIYIYHGGTASLRLAQRIAPQDIGTDLFSFGWYISVAYDIDNNQYPDFLVGSYLSDTVTIFRTRPIIRLNFTIDVTPAVIPLNSSGFPCQDELFRPCATVNVCFTYNGKTLPDNILIVFNISADILRTKGNPVRSSRVFFKNTGLNIKDEIVQGQEEVLKFEERCLNISAVVKSENREFFIHSDEELVFELSVELVEMFTPGNVPLILDDAPKFKQASSNFSTKCIGNCRPDLRIQLEIDPVKVLLQEYSELLLTIHVYNDGDKALGTEIVIESSNNTKYLNFHQPQDFKTELVTCVNNEETNNIICDLRNTFFKETTIHVWFAVNNTLLIHEDEHPGDFAQNISFTAVVDSITSDRNLSDNQMTLTTVVIIQSTVEITGISVPYELHITDGGDSNLTFTHKYHILNHGPSPLINGRMYVCLPVPIDSGKNDSITPENIKVNSSSDDTTVHILQIHEGQWYRNLSATPEIPDPISCNLDRTERYLLVKVVVNMLKKNTEIQVDIQVCIKENSLYFEQLAKLVYTSVGEIVTRDDERYVTNAINKTFSVSSTIYKEQAVSSKTITSRTEKVNPWIIVGSSFGGLVLLIIVTLIFRKCGFFKRPKRDKMLRFKRHKHYHRRKSVVPEGVEVPHHMRRGSVQHHDDIHVTTHD